MATSITRTIVLNGTSQTVTVADDREQLLYVLRNMLGQLGPRFGCGVAQCGSCTVLVNGQVKRSCLAPMRTISNGTSVETMDGIGSPDAPHPLQRAFIAEQGAQCAVCVNGVVMGALGWIRSRVAAGNSGVPSEAEIRDFLSGATPNWPLSYLCRCGAHARIVRSIRVAAEEMLP